MVFYFDEFTGRHFVQERCPQTIRCGRFGVFGWKGSDIRWFGLVNGKRGELLVVIHKLSEGKCQWTELPVCPNREGFGAIRSSVVDHFFWFNTL